MEPVICHLRDRNEALVAAWTDAFKGVDAVRPCCGDIFAVKADALVSPANSFGFMDGGIDGYYTTTLGWQVQERLQLLLRREHDGELLVGQAVLVETGHPRWPWLISAPTMRVPMNVSDTPNAYLAFRAVLRLVQRKNQERPGAIKSILCPGLGTATGRMSPNVCARQMRLAWRHIIEGQRQDFDSLWEASREHLWLVSEEA